MISLVTLTCVALSCFFSLTTLLFFFFHFKKQLSFVNKKTSTSVGNTKNSLNSYFKEVQTQIQSLLDCILKLEKDVCHNTNVQSAEIQRVTKNIIEENFLPLHNFNQRVDKHMFKYDAILESQERLIEAVNNLINVGPKRHE